MCCLQFCKLCWPWYLLQIKICCKTTHSEQLLFLYFTKYSWHICVLNKVSVLHYVSVLCAVSCLQGNWSPFMYVTNMQTVVHAKITEIENCVVLYLDRQIEHIIVVIIIIIIIYLLSLLLLLLLLLLLWWWWWWWWELCWLCKVQWWQYQQGWEWWYIGNGDGVILASMRVLMVMLMVVIMVISMHVCGCVCQIIGIFMPDDLWLSHWTLWQGSSV